MNNHFVHRAASTPQDHLLEMSNDDSWQACEVTNHVNAEGTCIAHNVSDCDQLVRAGLDDY
jgi:hypothetical protein